MLNKSCLGKHICYLIIVLAIFSPQVSAQQTGTFVDARDGHVYKWVKIGDQVWMAENLSYLPSVHSPYDKTIHPLKKISYEVDKEIMNTPYQFVYGYDGNNVDAAKKTEAFQDYGVIYNLASAKKSCPSGWHLPSDEEWKQLEKLAGMDSKEIDLLKYARGNISDKLKGEFGWDEAGKGTNEYSLNLSPGGMLYIVPDIDKGATFSDIGNGGYFWSSSEYSHPIGGNRFAITRSVFGKDVFGQEEGNKYVTRSIMERYYGLSVRCVK